MNIVSDVGIYNKDLTFMSSEFQMDMISVCIWGGEEVFEEIRKENSPNLGKKP